MVEFLPARACKKMETCIDHISCCNVTEYTQFIQGLLQPLLEFEKKNPLPPFKRIRKCDLNKQTHRDYIQCCNEDVFEVYKAWRQTILNARNLTLPFYGPGK